MLVHRGWLVTRAVYQGSASGNWQGWMKRTVSSVKASAAVEPLTDATQAKKRTIMPLGQPMKMRANPALKKIDTLEYQSIFTDELRSLIALFRKYNYELRIAGGAVRDIVMEITPKDIDLATTATPDQMKEMFTAENVRMINTKGEKHGTITPRINNKENFEVTTLRIDVVTDGRHAEVQFTTDWQLDANRRDLTINSMFLDFEGMLYDYFFGYEDLLDRRVVFVGNAGVRIQEDYLRILRYFRFYGRIARDASRHDANTLLAIRNNAVGLARISGERIWTELQKIVVGNFGRELVLEMLQCNLLAHCGLPEDVNRDEFERLHETLKNFAAPHHPILFMAALLRSEEDATKLHQRLKFSVFERDLALFLVQARDKVTEEYRTLRDCQRACMQPYAQRAFVEQLLKYSGQQELYEALTAWEKPRFPVSGNMLMQRGCPGDRRMGVVMQHLKDVWIESDFTITGEELLDVHLPTAMTDLSSATASPTTAKKKHRQR